MKLKQYIEENNLKISLVSKESGIPYSTVSELVNGKRTLNKCTADTVYSLAKYLGTSMEDLLVCENDNIFSNKFNLSQDQCRFLAKKKWDESVYCGMRMEARAVTFPQTKTILDGVNVPAVCLDDILAIRNMRDAWKVILDYPEERISFDYICKLNGLIARNESIEWGVLRSGSVGISGCSYNPAIPEPNKVKGDIHRILNSYVSATEKALNLFCYITYNQLFWDGNKRTALVAASKLLLDNGCGMLTVNDRNMQRFNELLLNMYETGNKEPLIKFLYENAIIGILTSDNPM